MRYMVHMETTKKKQHVWKMMSATKIMQKSIIIKLESQMIDIQNTEEKKINKLILTKIVKYILQNLYSLFNTSLKKIIKKLLKRK